MYLVLKTKSFLTIKETTTQKGTSFHSCIVCEFKYQDFPPLALIATCIRPGILCMMFLMSTYILSLVASCAFEARLRWTLFLLWIEV